MLYCTHYCTQYSVQSTNNRTVYATHCVYEGKRTKFSISTHIFHISMNMLHSYYIPATDKYIKQRWSRVNHCIGG